MINRALGFAMFGAGVLVGIIYSFQETLQHEKYYKSVSGYNIYFEKRLHVERNETDVIRCGNCHLTTSQEFPPTKS